MSILWSPKEKNLLISGDSQGFLRLWDVNKEKLLDSNKIFMHSSIKTYKENSLIGIDWDLNDNIIAAAGIYIKLFKYENGKLIQYSNSINEYISPTNIFQVKFNPFSKENLNFLACCSDGIIRNFNEKNAKCTLELTSHTEKVFGISFHPVRNNVFASSSDDSKIGIWDLNKSQKANFLNGHTNKVRQILWFIDQCDRDILISGSWDGNIKFWDVENMSCIYTITEHYSDVYGLDICHNHPYLLISSSRDNSIRFWNVPFLADQMVINIH
jgi:WD40 repeat protein